MPTAFSTTPLAEQSAGMLVVAAFAPESAAAGSTSGSAGAVDDGASDSGAEASAGVGAGARPAPPELSEGARALGEALGIDLAAELVAVGFEGKVATSVRVPTRGRLPAPVVLVVGLGSRAEVTTHKLRRAAAVAAQAASRVERLATDLHLAIGGDVAAAAQAVTEGLKLGSYRYTEFKTEPSPWTLANATLHGGDEDATTEGIAVGAAVARGVKLTRDLVNTPPQAKRPPVLAERVVAEVEGTAVTARVLDEEALREGGYGGLLGVGQGSAQPPRLVELVYAPEAATRHVALVGKGITFDTGGLSLKPSAAMETMKMDMAGAASVLGVMLAAADLALSVRITGVLALAENLPSGTATRVSDVLTIKGGTTVEVMNTDAEGRLVLADALGHAAEHGPDAIVDLATLTGAAVVALGERIGVLMATDDDLADELLDAATESGEPFWRLPMGEEQYGAELEGDVADLRNVGGKGAGTIRAGLFLSRFVDDGTPWAHLDIAGVAWTDKADAELTKGATAVPVRTLLTWLRTL